MKSRNPYSKDQEAIHWLVERDYLSAQAGQILLRLSEMNREWIGKNVLVRTGQYKLMSGAVTGISRSAGVDWVWIKIGDREKYIEVPLNAVKIIEQEKR